MRNYTPLTFDYVVSSMIRRFGGDKWFSDTLDKLAIDSSFHLNRRTVEAWKNGQEIMKWSTDVLLSSAISKRSLIGAPILRLVFVSQATLTSSSFQQSGQTKGLFGNIQTGLSGPNVHYIDNLQLKIGKSANGGIGTASISFLMVPDHGLEETHSGYVLDLISGLPIFFLPVLSSIRVEKFTLPYPVHPSGLPLASLSQLMVASCVESDCQYTLDISINCDESISGKLFSVMWKST